MASPKRVAAVRADGVDRIDFIGFIGFIGFFAFGFALCWGTSQKGICLDLRLDFVLVKLVDECWTDYKSSQ